MTAVRDPSRCVVLVPANFGIEPECERGLAELERRGYAIWRIRGFAAIDQGRSQAATDALARGFEELFWIDADIEFPPDAVDQLRAHNLPIVSAIYPKKNSRALASYLLPSTKEITFGVGGGLLEIMYAAAGFLYTRREVYDAIREKCRLPICNHQFGQPLVPYFMPMVTETEKGPWYLAEDFAFSQRAREAGYKVFADTTIRLGHIGRYAYGWEEAGGAQHRYATFKFRVADAQP